MGVLDGKVALVTGSTSGIGKAIAEGFAAAGAKLWLHGYLDTGGSEFAEQLGAHFVQADFTHPDEIQALADAILQSEDHLDILVNNAGVEIIMAVETMDMAQFDRIWMVNVRAPVHLTHSLLPLLKKADGASIVNITSIHDSVPYPHNSAYSISKAALAMFTRTAAVELAPMGIRVNNLAPGAVETEMNRDVIRSVGEDQFREWIPLGRVARTSEMIDPAIFLASDASRYITGATLYADGGYMLNLIRYRPEA